MLQTNKNYNKKHSLYNNETVLMAEEEEEEKIEYPSRHRKMKQR